MLILRTLSDALALRRAYSDICADEPGAAARWERIANTFASDMTKASKYDERPSGAANAVGGMSLARVASRQIG
jgi:hypothetical protein